MLSVVGEDSVGAADEPEADSLGVTGTGMVVVPEVLIEVVTGLTSLLVVPGASEAGAVVVSTLEVSAGAELGGLEAGDVPVAAVGATSVAPVVEALCESTELPTVKP